MAPKAAHLEMYAYTKAMEDRKRVSPAPTGTTFYSPVSDTAAQPDGSDVLRPRTWTDKTGKFSCVAVPSKLVKDRIRLRRVDTGEEVWVTADDLSTDDREFVHMHGMEIIYRLDPAKWEEEAKMRQLYLHRAAGRSARTARALSYMADPRKALQNFRDQSHLGGTTKSQGWWNAYRSNRNVPGSKSWTMQTPRFKTEAYGTYNYFRRR